MKEGNQIPAWSHCGSEYLQAGRWGILLAIHLLYCYYCIDPHCSLWTEYLSCKLYLIQQAQWLSQ